MFTTETEKRDVRDQADELPRAHPDLQHRHQRELPRSPAADEPSSGPASAVGTSRAGRCTASCGSAQGGPPTTPASSAHNEQLGARRLPRSSASSSRSKQGTSGFETIVTKLATRPEKRLGTDEMWDRYEKALGEAVERGRSSTSRSTPAKAPVYGPNSSSTSPTRSGGWWQLGTIQVDFNLPDRLGHPVRRRGQRRARPAHAPPGDPREHRAVPRHPDRAPRRRVPAVAGPGAGDRPVDRRPPRRRTRARSQRSAAPPRACGSSVDDRTESVGRKIRDAELRKVPYMLVVGDREAEQRRGRAARATARATSGTLAARRRDRPAERRSTDSRRADPRAILLVLIKRSNSAPRTS